MANTIDSTAVRALVKVKGRAHVLDVIYDHVDELANKGQFDEIDLFVQESCNPRLETWFHLGVLTVTYEFRMFLENRGDLFRIAHDRIAGEQDVITAEKTLTGLL